MRVGCSRMARLLGKFPKFHVDSQITKILGKIKKQNILLSAPQTITKAYNIHEITNT